MIAIRNYNNTQKELNIALKRLNRLLGEKEELYTKFFPMTIKIDEDVVKGGTKLNPQIEYQIALDTTRKHTGLSLREEIEKIQDEVKSLRECLKTMDDDLKKMTGLEEQLYRKIVVEGLRISRAVELVAEDNHYSSSQMWRYYEKIEPKIKKVKDDSEMRLKSVVKSKIGT